MEWEIFHVEIFKKFNTLNILTVHAHCHIIELIVPKQCLDKQESKFYISHYRGLLITQEL